MNEEIKQKIIDLDILRCGVIEKFRLKVLFYDAESRATRYTSVMIPEDVREFPGRLELLAKLIRERTGMVVVPCRHCGGENVSFYDIGDNGDEWKGACRGCGNTPEEILCSRISAVINWNRRQKLARERGEIK